MPRECYAEVADMDDSKKHTAHKHRPVDSGAHGDDADTRRSARPNRGKKLPVRMWSEVHTQVSTTNWILHVMRGVYV